MATGTPTSLIADFIAAVLRARPDLRPPHSKRGSVVPLALRLNALLLFAAWFPLALSAGESAPGPAALGSGLTAAKGPVPEALPAPAVTCAGAYTAEVIGVAVGGRRRGAVYQALAEAAVEADLGALVGAPAGTVLRVSGIFPHGGDFSGTHLGDLQGASNIAAHHAPSLYECWLATELAGGRLTLRAGRLVAENDFATTESGGVFLNSSFGWPAFISTNTCNTGPAFDRSALGIQAAFGPTDQITLRAGLYDGDTLDDPAGDPARHPHGLHFELDDNQGAFALAELGVMWPAGPAAPDRPGGFKVGAWIHTADFADLSDPVRNHRGNYGVYFLVEQLLWPERGASSGTGATQGLTGFARTGFSPGDRNLYSQTADAGLSYLGLLPGRPGDTLGFGLAWARLSGGLRQAERTAGASVASDQEVVVELCYQLALRDQWSLSPDLQWIVHPGGSRALGDALVLGLRTRRDF